MIRGEAPGFHLLPGRRAGGLFIPLAEPFPRVPGGAPICLGARDPDGARGTRRAWRRRLGRGEKVPGKWKGCRGAEKREGLRRTGWEQGEGGGRRERVQGGERRNAQGEGSPGRTQR